MRRRSSLLIAILLLLTLLAPASSAAIEDVDIAAALRFRAAFGLNADRGYVAQLVADPRNLENRYGAPLTAEEVQNLDERRLTTGNLDDLVSYLESLRAEFGGLYVDQVAGGVIDISFVNSANRDAAIQARLPAGSSFRTRVVSHTWAELRTMQARVDSDRAWQESSGLQVITTESDPVVNRVRVGLSDVNDHTRALMATRYGAMIELVKVQTAQLTACSSRTNCPGPPLRAGISVTRSGNTCSMAFMTVQQGAYRWLTAGHCGNNGSSWTHAGIGIGTMRDDVYFDGSWADAATVGNINDTYADNWLYRTPTQAWSINSAQSTNDSVGQIVCLSGYTQEANRCGTIKSRTQTITFDYGTANQVTLYNQRRANYAWYFGDSGGATFDGGAMAMGIQSGCIDMNGDGVCTQGASADQATYSHIQHAFGYLGDGIYLYTGN